MKYNRVNVLVCEVNVLRIHKHTNAGFVFSLTVNNFIQFSFVLCLFSTGIRITFSVKVSVHFVLAMNFNAMRNCRCALAVLYIIYRFGL